MDCSQRYAYAHTKDKEKGSHAKDMAAIYTGMTRPLRKYGLDLTEATLKEWAMSHGLDSNIDKMTQAEKTMLRYQYVMTRAAGSMGDFAKTADTWANAMRTVKQLLQEFARVIGEALINALKPALLAFRQFMFNLLSAAEKGLNALGKLLGWQQIDFGSASLAEDTEDYAEALDDAAGAAKKLNGQLRGIDELNNLTSNNGSGSGAGGSGITGADAADIWENIPENTKIYESTVESFYDFGQRVAEAMKQGLDNVDWNAVYERVGNFGTNFASFLNGLFQPDTFASLGKTIAGGLNTAFRLAFSFGSEFNFRNAGVSLAELINNLFADFDFAQAAQTINTWAKGLFDFINGLLRGDENGEGGLDTELIGDKLKEFFGNLDIAGWSALALPLLAKLASKLVKGTIKTIALLAGKQIETVLIPAVTKEIGTFFSTILANPVGLIRTVGGFLIRVFKGAFAAVFAALGGYTIGNGLGEIFSLLTGDYDMAQEYEDKSLLSLLGIDMDLWEESWQETFDDLGLDKLFSGDMLGFIKNGMEYNYGWLWELIKGPEAVDFLVEKWNGIKDSLDPFAKVIAEKITGVDETLGEWWDNTMVPMFDFPKWEGLFTTIPDALKQVWEEAVLFWTTDVPKWWNDNVAPWFTKEKWKTLYSSIKTALEDKWNEASSWWNEKVSGFVEDAKKWFTKEKWLEIVSGIAEALTDVWSDPLSVAKGFFNSLADYAEGFINGVIDGFGKLHNLKNLFSDKNESFNIDHIKIPRFAEGGFPTVGSLFVAGEAGSELVGNINGRTGVVSNGEISGIASAIRSTSDTEVQLLRQQNVLLQGILEKEFGITDGQIFNSVRKSSREYTRSTGLYAF